MEHRWGRRLPLLLPVRLVAGRGEPAAGDMVNVSISGALLQTGLSLPAGARLEIEVILPGELGEQPARLAAHVIRRTQAGVGVEWCELAPPAVRAWLAAADPSTAPCFLPQTPRNARPSLVCTSG